VEEGRIFPTTCSKSYIPEYPELAEEAVNPISYIPFSYIKAELVLGHLKLGVLFE